MLLLAAHTKRHTLQMEEIMSSADFLKISMVRLNDSFYGLGDLRSCRICRCQNKPTFAAMTTEQIKDMRDRVLVLRRFL